MTSLISNHLRSIFIAFLTLGCWKDKCNADCSQRLLENMEGKSQYINATLYGHYKRRSNAVHRCADAALDLGYDIFAIQDGGQCFSGKDAGKKYKDNGKSTDCASMKGGPLANDVYTISKLLSYSHIRDRIIRLSKAKELIISYFKVR